MHMVNTESRLIGRFDTGRHGTLIVAIGAMHGNEPAGVRALEALFPLLEAHRDEARFEGRIVGLVGNVPALAWRERYVDRDLNRSLDPDYFGAAATARGATEVEAYEALELTRAVHREVTEYDPTRVILLDLHTTTADGGAFSLICDNPESRALGLALYAPVILGMAEELHHTTLHYFTTERLGVLTTAMVFESGQHDDPASADAALAAIVLTLRHTGALDPGFPTAKYSDYLSAYAKTLPSIVQVVGRHQIRANEAFRMRLGYKNFDPVQRGEYLADNRDGPVFSPAGGRILMPLYQKLGEDGYFIIEDVPPAGCGASAP